MCGNKQASGNLEMLDQNSENLHINGEKSYWLAEGLKINNLMFSF